MARAPLAGPVRLREIETDPARLDALKAAFDESVELFGLTDYLPKKTEGR
jgi:MarR family transcriptional regulator, temperature-dependent positive regulator of motility